MAIIDQSPRMTPNLNPSSVEGNTPTNRTPDEQKASELKGILNFINPGADFKYDVTPFGVKKGNADDTPKPDGAARNRSDGVKNFFKGIGQGIGSFFSKIGNAFGTAFEAIKGAVASRTGGAVHEATTPKPQQDKQVTTLKSFVEALGKSLETSYKDYLASTDDTPPKSRSDFVKEMLPNPNGGTDGIDKDSITFIGDMIDDVRANIDDAKDPGETEMRQAVLERFSETPTLDIASGALFQEELKALDTDPTTFLRTDTAFTKLDNFVSHKAIDFERVGQELITAQSEAISNNGHLGIVDGIGMGMSKLNQEQADAMLKVADGLLTDMLDTDFDNPKSLANAIDPNFLRQLSDNAQKIMAHSGGSVDERKDNVKTMYANTLFLRGTSGALVEAARKDFAPSKYSPSGDKQTFIVQTLQFTQTFLNGSSLSKGNDIGKEAMQTLIAKHQPRLDAFLEAIGMPTFADDEKETISE